MAIVPPLISKPAVRSTAQVQEQLSRAQSRLRTSTAVSFARDQRAPGISQATGKQEKIQQLHQQVRALRQELQSRKGR